MDSQPEQPDPSIYIERLSDGNAFYREAAAWTLGEIGSPRAARPLAGLLLRELQSVECSGYIAQRDVVRAVVEAIRRIGATEALYALVKALCVLTHSRGVDEETVEEIVEALNQVGGPTAVREAADRIVQCARECKPVCPGLHVVGAVLLARLSLCGDAALSTLRRVATRGPVPLQPFARRALASM